MSLPKKHTENWLKTVIIPYNLCPFARAVVEKENALYYCVDESNAMEENLQTLIAEAWRLDNDDEIETTLIIYENAFSAFEDFLDYVELANQLLEMQHYLGIYQLAHFHPDYCFEGANELDAANYTNRAPYPMLHLIREASLEKALKSFSHPEMIPKRNIQLTRELGLEKMQALLATCKIS